MRDTFGLISTEGDTIKMDRDELVRLRLNWIQLSYLREVKWTNTRNTEKKKTRDIGGE